MAEPERVDLDDYKIPELPTCKCGNLLIRRGHWVKANEAEREEMLEDGFVRESAHTPMVCTFCDDGEFSAHARARMGLRGDTLATYKKMTAEGATAQEVADHLGIKRKTVLRAVSAARKEGKL